ncbi:MAG: ABC transporter ATP-binding protein [Candidatus Bathyarchaeota archaeon]|nr:ABC transporter ATP-binding protein [Candidatus Bathyarchaeota archaeon]MDH5780880.1 ABC transporter ATP-binding protein [Candidatus Bathyarchaeota archaeon]
MPLLEIDSLTIDYRTRRGNIRAVNNVSFTLEKGETLGLVGESGSGKSTLGLSVIRLVPPPGVIVSGHIRIDGTDILNLSKEEMRSIRGKKVALVFQDPMTSLNPVKKVGAHFIELIRTHELDVSEREALERAEKALNDVGILPERINDYPHQFSGGMRQRIMIALAIALNPDLVIADEPTTALDVIVQAKILDLLKSLRDRYGMALILITHDLSIVLERCDKIIVIYAGSLVEYASSLELHRNPRHPYTQGLLQSIPNIELAEQKLEAIPGSPPNLLNPPKGCRFWSRCSFAKKKCHVEEPPIVESSPGHFVRCFTEAHNLERSRKR